MEAVQPLGQHKKDVLDATALVRYSTRVPQVLPTLSRSRPAILAQEKAQLLRFHAKAVVEQES